MTTPAQVASRMILPTCVAISGRIHLPTVNVYIMTSGNILPASRWLHRYVICCWPNELLTGRTCRCLCWQIAWTACAFVIGMNEIRSVESDVSISDNRLPNRTRSKHVNLYRVDVFTFSVSVLCPFWTLSVQNMIVVFYCKIMLYDINYTHARRHGRMHTRAHIF